MNEVTAMNERLQKLVHNDGVLDKIKQYCLTTIASADDYIDTNANGYDVEYWKAKMELAIDILKIIEDRK